MKSKARIHKTLASLAVAMTATAAGLHWMDPSPCAGRPLSADQIVSMTKAAVTDFVRINPGQWHDVEISTDDDISGGLTLAASRDHRQCHFFIDAAGRPSQDARWVDQFAWQEKPHTIRIHLERAMPEGPTQAQWYTARSLVLALDAALSANGTIPIRFSDFDSETVVFSSNL